MGRSVHQQVGGTWHTSIHPEGALYFHDHIRVCHLLPNMEPGLLLLVTGYLYGLELAVQRSPVQNRPVCR
jgi:hypothetical protein